MFHEHKLNAETGTIYSEKKTEENLFKKKLCFSKKQKISVSIYGKCDHIRRMRVHITSGGSLV